MRTTSRLARHWVTAAFLVCAGAIGAWVASLRATREPIDRRIPDDSRHGKVSATTLSEGPRYGGVPLYPGRSRDAIPPLDHPEFTASESSSTGMAALNDDDWVVSVSRKGNVRAYPLWILEAREIVNDPWDGEPICVTYCPLSASAVVFESRIGNREVSFGNEGALYDCNLVLYDRETQSLWYQLRGSCISGPSEGSQLTQVPCRLMRWGGWRRQHPEGLVLVSDQRTGRLFRIPKDASNHEPSTGSSPAYPVSRMDLRLPAMEKVLGLEMEGTPVCFTESWVRALREGRHELPGRPGVVMVIGLGTGVAAYGVDGVEIPVVGAYWFAWHAAFPSGVVLTNGR